MSFTSTVMPISSAAPDLGTGVNLVHERHRARQRHCCHLRASRTRTGKSAPSLISTQTGNLTLLQNTSTGYIAAWLMNGTFMVEGIYLSPAQVADTAWRIVGPR